MIRDLSDRRTGGNPRRWAGWFLQLADEQGQFFRTPVGHPALQVVGADPAVEVQPLEPPTSATVSARQGAFALPHAAELVRELSARQQQAVQLLERARRLQHELSLLCAANLSIRARARELVAHARLATVQGHDIGFFRTANALARPSAPHLVAVPPG